LYRRRDRTPERPAKPQSVRNVLSEAIHEAKKTVQTLYALQLEDFPKKPRDFLLKSAFAALPLHEEHF
jgi:hypothetical protein